MECWGEAWAPAPLIILFSLSPRLCRIPNKSQTHRMKMFPSSPARLSMRCVLSWEFCLTVTDWRCSSRWRNETSWSSERIRLFLAAVWRVNSFSGSWLSFKEEEDEKTDKNSKEINKSLGNNSMLCSECATVLRCHKIGRLKRRKPQFQVSLFIVTFWKMNFQNLMEIS